MNGVNKSNGKRGIKDLVKMAVEQGWEVEKAKCGHYKFKPVDKTKGVMYCASTPSDYRAFMNILQELKQHGLKI